MSDLVMSVARAICGADMDPEKRVQPDEWDIEEAKVCIKAVAEWLNEEGPYWYKLPAAYLLAQLEASRGKAIMAGGEG